MKTIILQVTNNYFGDKGGITTYVYQLDAGINKHSISHESKVFYMGNNKRKYPLKLLRLFHLLLRLHWEGRKFIIITHSSLSLAVFSAVLQKMKFRTYHIIHSPNMTRTHFILLNILRPQYIFVSKATKNLFDKQGLIIDDFKILPGGIEKPINTSNLDFHSRDIDLAFVGRFTEEKGLKELLNTFTGLGNLSIAVAGVSNNKQQEMYKDECLQLVQANSRLVVKHFGEINNSDICAMLSRCKILVVPSIWEEPAPMVVVEARSVGTPTIAFNVGGLTERLVDNIDGKIIPRANYEKMWANILSLVDDKIEWEKYNESCIINFKENDSINKMVYRLENYLL